MSHLSKFLLVSALVVFVLACNLVTQPIDDAQNLAETAQSLASAIPAETLAAIASQIPIGTLEALPSGIPEIDEFFNPQGTPVADWNGIPILSQATAGQEFNENTYSFRASVTAREAYDFYNGQMISLGWSQTMGLPANDNGGVLVFSKEARLLTITITAADDSTVVLLAIT